MTDVILNGFPAVSEKQLDYVSSPDCSRQNSSNDEEERFLQFASKLQEISEWDSEALLSAQAVDSAKFIYSQTKASNHNNNIEVLERLEQELMQSGFLSFYLKMLLQFSEQCNFPTAFIHLNDVVWNMTHLSKAFCKQLHGLAGIERVVSALDRPCFDKENLRDRRLLRLVSGFLSILHNIIRTLPSSRHNYRNSQCSLVEVIKKYLSLSSHLSIKTRVLLLLSFVVDEAENQWLNVTSCHIKFLVQNFQETLETDTSPHFSAKNGYDSEELLVGINNLCSCDWNKDKFLESGLLPAVEDLLLRPSATEAELRQCVKTVYHFSFDDRCKDAICQRPALVRRLQELAESSTDKHLLRSVCGSLWKLQVSQPLSSTSSSFNIKPLLTSADSVVGSGHVMLSYQHSYQDAVLSLKKSLELEGYSVWIDIEHMSQSIVAKMAEAVENSSVILLCMSQSYKNSPHCRHEADYAYKLQKTLIPLVMEPDFQPDGWLGLLCGSKMYYDFSDEDSFDESLANLLGELGGRGKDPMESSVRSLRGLHVGHSMKSAESSGGGMSNQACGTVLRHYTQHRNRHSTAFLFWNQDEVTTWLQDNNLFQYKDHFHGMDGELLFELHHMHAHAPQAFYSYMKDNLGLTLVDVLRLTRALNKLCFQ